MRCSSMWPHRIQTVRVRQRHARIHSRSETSEALIAVLVCLSHTDGWERLAQFDEVGDGYKVLWLNMTSQAWLTPADVSQSIWWHWIAVIVPQNLNSSFASKGLM